MTSLPSPQTREQDSEWIEHDGKGMPVDGNTLLDIEFADGTTVSGTKARTWGAEAGVDSNWFIPADGYDGSRIRSYRIHKPSSQGEEQ